MDTPDNGNNALLTVLIGIVLIPILLLVVPIVLAIVEYQLFGTHFIEQVMIRIHLNDVHLWIYRLLSS